MSNVDDRTRVRFTSLTSNGVVAIDGAELTPGLYFSTLEVNGIATSTKRFVVAK